MPLGERHTAAMVRIAQAWRPDLLVHTGWEYAGPLAAARLGIPAVLHGWGLAAPAELDAPIARALEPLHRKWGLDAGVPEPWREIDVCPPSLQVRDHDRPLVKFGWAPYNGSGVVPAWLLGAPERRRICVTLGNVPIMGDHATVLASVLAGVRGLDAEVVIAGSARLAYDGLPEGVRVLSGLPLSAILPGCDLVVHHGGAGSAFAALALGLPSLALPQMCVQYQHADRIAEVGAGLCLHPEQVTADSLAAALRTLTENTDYRDTARRLRQELAEQPPAGEAMAQLEAAAR
ncbi:glycosyltransferase [Kitasatospora sp. NPDC002227]|uniref:glycosyltransferase n=1 Tax=Kitasatospora sp. NPDC002227 TaxID=3154773 RepID=UPI003328FD28